MFVFYCFSSFFARFSFNAIRDINGRRHFPSPTLSKNHPHHNLLCLNVSHHFTWAAANQG